MTAVVAVVSALLGGGMWSVASTWLSVRSQGEQSENSRLHADLREMKEAHEDCRAKLEIIERRLDVVEHHHGSLVPRWVKDAAKRLQWVNGAAMVTIFGPLGLGRDDVEGRTFAELLDPSAAREIDRLDRAALVRPGCVVSTMLQLHPQLPMMMIAKIAGAGRDNELIYEGYAFRSNDPADVSDRASRREQEQLGASFLRLQADEEGNGDSVPE